MASSLVPENTSRFDEGTIFTMFLWLIKLLLIAALIFRNVYIFFNYYFELLNIFFHCRRWFQPNIYGTEDY